jgi:hypothetical protein
MSGGGGAFPEGYAKHLLVHVVYMQYMRVQGPFCLCRRSVAA